MATYIPFSGWNPNFVTYGYPGNDSSLTILHQASSSFPLTPNTRTTIGPISSTGLTTFIRLDGAMSTSVPVNLELSLYAATSAGSARITTIEKDATGLRFVQDNFYLPVALGAVNSSTGDFFIYIGVQTSLISGALLQAEADVSLTISRYILYSSVYLPTLRAIKPNLPTIPYIAPNHC